MFIRNIKKRTGNAPLILNVIAIHSLKDFYEHYNDIDMYTNREPQPITDTCTSTPETALSQFHPSLDNKKR